MITDANNSLDANLSTHHPRLIDGITREEEWLYLVSETYAGEIVILPLLDRLIQRKGISSTLKKVLELQRAEEAAHVKLYAELLGNTKLHTTGYADEFVNYVESLPDLTSELFVIQTVLESISLGALEYRLQTDPKAPSAAVDRVVAKDEEGHVNFGMAFIDEMKARDGIKSNSDFRLLGRQANQVFAKHFSGKVISDFVASSFGKSVDPLQVDSSSGMRIFRRISTEISTQNRIRFLKRYSGTSLC